MINIKCTHFIGNASDINKFKWGGNPEGSIDIYDDRIDVFTKSKVVGVMFGAIGSAIEGKGKADYTVYKKDITSYKIELDQTRFYISLRDGRTFFVSASKKVNGPLIEFLNKPNPTQPTYATPKEEVPPHVQPQPTYTAPKEEVKKEVPPFVQPTSVKETKVEQPKVQPTEDPMIAQLTALKQLLDAGILTQEEFDFKKKQILGMDTTEAPKEKKDTNEDLLKRALEAIPNLEPLMKDESYELVCQEMRKYKQYLPTRYYFENGTQVDSKFTGKGLIVGSTFVYYGDIKDGMRHGEGENVLVEDGSYTVVTGYFINNELYGPCYVERHAPESKGFIVKKDIGTFFKNMYNGDFLYDILWADSSHYQYKGSAVNGKLTVIDKPNIKYPVGYDEEHDQVFGYNTPDFVNDARVVLE